MKDLLKDHGINLLPEVEEFIKSDAESTVFSPKPDTYIALCKIKPVFWPEALDNERLLVISQCYSREDVSNAFVFKGYVGNSDDRAVLVFNRFSGSVSGVVDFYDLPIIADCDFSTAVLVQDFQEKKLREPATLEAVQSVLDTVQTVPCPLVDTYDEGVAFQFVTAGSFDYPLADRIVDRIGRVHLPFYFIPYLYVDKASGLADLADYIGSSISCFKDMRILADDRACFENTVTRLSRDEGAMADLAKCASAYKAIPDYAKTMKAVFVDDGNVAEVSVEADCVKDYLIKGRFSAMFEHDNVIDAYKLPSAFTIDVAEGYPLRFRHHADAAKFVGFKYRGVFIWRAECVDFIGNKGV